jgi:multidrug resistance efflux pump
MFDIANLEHLAEDKAIDAKIAKLRAERDKTLAQIEKAKREIAQEENKIKRLMRKHSKQEYRARTRRLIQRGAIAEKFVDNAEDITNDEFTDALAQTFRATTD